MMQTVLVAAPVALWGMAAIYMILFFLFLKLAQGEPKHPVPLLMAGVAFGLCYDAVVLGLGAFLGDTKLLRTLSYPRYVLHGAMVPLLIPICAHALEADRKVLKAAFPGPRNWPWRSPSTMCRKDFRLASVSALLFPSPITERC